MLGDQIFPADRWYRVGATADEVAYLSDWHDTLEMSSGGGALISSAAYSDWDLAQQLDAWRTEGIFPPPPSEEPAADEAPASRRAKAEAAPAEA